MRGGLPRRGRWPGATGCCVPRRATRRSCRSCTGPPASGGSTSGRSRLAPRLRGLGPGAHRQRRVGPVPARRVRRGHVGALTRHAGRACEPAGAGLGPAARADGLPRDRVGASRTTASGRCAARAATSPTPRSWPGWPSTGPIHDVEEFGLEGPLEQVADAAPRRSTTRCARRAIDAEHNTFTQYYGSDELDASVLMIPLVGFLPPRDPRVVGTVEAIERELMEGGFVLRYDSQKSGACRRAHRPRGGVPGLLVLAGGLPAPDRTRR